MCIKITFDKIKSNNGIVIIERNRCKARSFTDQDERSQCATPISHSLGQDMPRGIQKDDIGGDVQGPGDSCTRADAQGSSV
jgi:hypothetical protein